MNRLKSSGSCRICRTWLEGEWANSRIAAVRAEIERQMAAGICDGCQRKRQLAAREYIAASDDVRLWFQVLTALGYRTPEQYANGMPDAMITRVKTAEERCISLGMWSRHRGADVPERFREPPKYRPRETQC
jgi:hypothetical protein